MTMLRICTLMLLLMSSEAAAQSAAYKLATAGTPAKDTATSGPAPMKTGSIKALKDNPIVQVRLPVPGFPDPASLPPPAPLEMLESAAPGRPSATPASPMLKRPEPPEKAQPVKSGGMLLYSSTGESQKPDPSERTLITGETRPRPPRQTPKPRPTPITMTMKSISFKNGRTIEASVMQVQQDRYLLRLKNGVELTVNSDQIASME